MSFFDIKINFDGEGIYINHAVGQESNWELEKIRIYLENKYRENKQFEKYQAFKMLIVENKTIIEIQKELGCGKNSPNNWSNEIIKELSVLLWGIDALDM